MRSSSSLLHMAIPQACGASPAFKRHVLPRTGLSQYLSISPHFAVFPAGLGGSTSGGVRGSLSGSSGRLPGIFRTVCCWRSVLTLCYPQSGSVPLYTVGVTPGVAPQASWAARRFRFVAARGPSAPECASCQLRPRFRWGASGCIYRAHRPFLPFTIYRPPQ